MKVSEARLSLLGKARARPDQVRKLVDSVAQQGPLATYQKAMSRLDSYTPLGYSLCGVVVEVGAGVDRASRSGDLVAAAGNEFALHAELNWVPVNLCVPVPDGVAPEHAAFATVGAIAMQGVRRGEVQLGETACVIGLGLVGQLVVRLLVAAGVRVVGVDTVPDRCRMAEKAGALACAGPGRRGRRRAVEQVLAAATARPRAPTTCSWPPAGRPTGRWSWRPGSPETAPASSTSARPGWTCRGTTTTRRSSTSGSRAPTARGGTTTATSSRASTTPPATSGGPSAATWQCFLDLIAERGGRGGDAGLRHPRHRRGGGAVRRAAHRRRCRASGSCSSTRGRRRASRGTGEPTPVDRDAARGADQAGPPRPVSGRDVRLGFIGAGNYATSMLLPHLARAGGRHARRGSRPPGRCRRSTPSASSGSRRATTDVDDVLDDPSIDAVFVVTRHHSHADFVCRALERGKAVFVEKPLALTQRRSSTGSWRRRAHRQRPADGRVQPPVRPAVHRPAAPLRPGRRAGERPLPRQRRAARPDAAGTSTRTWRGRGSSGEGGHFIDLLSAVTGQRPGRGARGPDARGADLHVTHPFRRRLARDHRPTSPAGTRASPRRPSTSPAAGAAPGSTTSPGRRSGRRRGKDVKRALTGQDKGQRSQLRHFVEAVRTGGPMPIALGLAGRARRGPPSPSEASLAVAGGGAAVTRVRGLVRPAAAADVAARGRAGAAMDEARHVAWARRQVRPGDDRRDLPRGLHGLRSFADARSPTAPASGCPSRPARPWWPPRTGCSPASGRCSARARPDIVGPGLVPRPGHRAARPAGRVSPSASTTATRSVTGNVKAVWELSRHHHLTVLASAWWLTGDERYAERASTPSCGRGGGRTRSSPGCTGPAASSSGSASRAGCGCAGCSHDWPKVGDLFETNEDALRQIWWHQQFLAAFPSRGSSANNHVVAEAAGLLAAACAFPWFAESDRWRDDASPPAAARASRANTFASGVNRELATDYHRFVTELGLVAAVGGGGRRHAARRRHLGAARRVARRRGRPARRDGAPAAPGRR